MSDTRTLALGLLIGAALTGLFALALGPWALLCSVWLAGLGVIVAQLAVSWRATLVTVETSTLIFFVASFVGGLGLLVWLIARGVTQ